jgi:organic radical activating enzyme
MDNRFLVPNIEVYITNVCNLNCVNCNRFNNHNFRGWQDWKDYESVYEQWAKVIRLDRVTFLGGEPLLNPSILQWIDGFNQVFKVRVQILTNGTRLNSVPGLYERCIDILEPQNGPAHGRNWIGVSIHNPAFQERYFDEIRKFLKGDIQVYTPDHPDNIDNCLTWGAQHAFVDENGVRVHVWDYTDFYTAAIQLNEQGRFTLHQSDPESAHAVCGQAIFKSYHFIRGKIYKCGPVGLFPEFDQQHNLDISAEDRALINAYRPLAVDEWQSRGLEFFDTIDNHIPQCKFCPVLKPTDFMTKLAATTKKRGSTSPFD